MGRVWFPLEPTARIRGSPQRKEPHVSKGTPKKTIRKNLQLQYLKFVGSSLIELHECQKRIEPLEKSNLKSGPSLKNTHVNPWNLILSSLFQGWTERTVGQMCGFMPLARKRNGKGGCLKNAKHPRTEGWSKGPHLWTIQ